MVRGKIGVQISTVSKDVAESIGLGKAQGALVTGIESGSPAEKAGVEAGDVITKFDGKPLEKLADLPRWVGNTKPGSKSTVTVFRRGKTLDLPITIVEIPSEDATKTAAVKEPEKAKSQAAAQQLGLVVSDLTDAQRKKLGLKGGVQIVSADEAAARAGLKQGDVILGIANTEISDVKQFEAAVAKADKSKPVNVLFRRGEWTQYVLIRPLK